MKKILPVLPLLLLFSCASKYYRYSFTMSYPVNASTPKYENDTLSISFNPTVTGIELDMFNKTNEGMKVEWDEMSISVNGKAYRVLHGQATIANITVAQPPSTIPPKSLLSDKIYPVNNVYTLKLNSQLYTVLKDLFPKTDYGNAKERKEILSRKGTRMVIYMPYYLSNKLVSAYYNIEITDIVKK